MKSGRDIHDTQLMNPPDLTSLLLSKTLTTIGTTTGWIAMKFAMNIQGP